MKILYIHGYGSHENNSTSRLIRADRPDDEVIAPAIPFGDPELSVRTIEKLIEEHEPDVLMGSSLGAFYLLQFDWGIPRILINPALPDNLKKIDDREDFISTLEKQFKNIKDTAHEFTIIYCGEDDDVAPNYDYFSNRYKKKKNISVHKVPHMNHSLSEGAMIGPVDDNLCMFKQYSVTVLKGTIHVKTAFFVTSITLFLKIS